MATMKPFLIIAFLISCTSLHCDGVPIGETCSRNEDCDGFPDSTLCEELMGNICYCNEQHVPVTGTPTTCEPIREEIGEPCKVNEQCKQGPPGDLSECLPSFDNPNQLICNCSEGNINQPGEHVCYPIQNFIGDPCEVNAQCSFHLSGWGACSDEKKCRCREGAVGTDEGDKCLPIRNELYLECQIKEQCTMGVPDQYSDCVEWFEDGNEEPSGKICNCTDIAINEPGYHKCYLRREKLGEECEVNAQCRVNMGELSECKYDTMCACTETKGVANLKNDFCLEIVNDIGNECEEDQQCTQGIPGDLSECMPDFEDETKLVCNCTEDAIDQPGKNVCHKKAEIVGDACVEQAQCTANLGDLAECYIDNSNPGVCKCKEGNIARHDGTLCLAIRQQLGETCEEDRQCKSGIPGEHSICLEGQCACDSGATNEPGQNICLERADIIGASCQANMQCKANLGPLSECLGGQCTCTPEYGVGNEKNDYCIAVINSIGGDCQESIQCKEGVPGEHSDCMESSILPGHNVCNCSVGAIHQVGRHKCYKVADKIGEECDIREQCWFNLGELSICMGGELGCRCVEGEAIANKEGDKCLEIIDKIGETCVEDGQCIYGAPGDLSECGRNDEYPYDNICKCMDIAVKHPSNEKCLIKAVNVGDRCEVGLQCTFNIGNLTECGNEGFCGCKEGAVGNAEGERDTKCIPGGILIGDRCFDKAQCVGEMDKTSTCDVGICGCLEGYTESMKLDNCLVIRNRLGEECEEIQQCQQGAPGELSECRDNACRCGEDATSEAGRHVCYLKATRIGDSCERNVQCVANLGQSQCLNGRCVCMQNSTGSGNGERCLEKVDLNERCEDNNQCGHMEHVTCREMEDESTCQCDEGYMEHPGKGNTCIKKAVLIGDTCEEDKSQCEDLEGATCHLDKVPRVCQCDDEGEVVSGDEKKCLKAVDNLYEMCNEHVQCRVVNSVCEFYGPVDHNACICGGGYIESSNGKCVPVRSQIGQTCEDSQQCVGIGMNVECILDKCQCKEPFDDYENKCYVPVKLGEICETTQQCHLGVNRNAWCNRSSSRCDCVETANQVGEICMATKVVGDGCELDLECTNSIIGPVYCSRLSNTCTCQNGYEGDMEGIRCKSGAYSVVLGEKSGVFWVGLIWLVSQYF